MPRFQFRLRTLLILATSISVCLACLSYFLFAFLSAPFTVIRELDTRYQQVQRGMSVEDVRRIMGREPEWHEQPLMGAWWDETALPPAEATRIRKSARYSVSTFYLPVIFEITFEEGGAVIGRHRYD